MMTGQKLGPYEIVGKLGEGGMGEVYRAHDARLHREVAIKVLPTAFAADHERLARFEREAQSLAALTHPNVAAIYGVEESSSGVALIMELVDGHTLADRMGEGPLSVSDALGVARQIADALEAAHEKGIVHRDLKPANIKVTPDGLVKVLDFGLAKAIEGAGQAARPERAGGRDLLNSPTITSPAQTVGGVILGTAAYMSPEQASGRVVDTRADIWAFGVVLFEMLSGRPLFRGETTAHIIAEVLKSEPDWSVLPASTPPEVRDLIERCLRKHPRSRLRDIGDARVLIEEWLAKPEKSRFAMQAQRTSSRNRRFIAVSVVSMLVAVIAIGTLLWSRRAVATAPSRTWEFPLGDYDVRFEFYDAPVIAPDGSMVAFSGAGKGPLRVRDTNALEPRTLAGTDGAIMPVWSPDSTQIAYTIVQPDQKTVIWKVPARGGTLVKICDAPPGALWGAAWLPDRQLLLNVVYGPADADFFVVPDGGGTPAPLAASDLKGAPISPVVLANGDLLFNLVANLETQPVVLRGKTGVPQIGSLADLGAFGMAYAAGHVLHTNRKRPGLWATPFDPDQVRVTAAGQLVAPDGMYPSVAADGTLVYKRRVGGAQQLAMVDRAGTVLGPVGERHEELLDPAVSPDGSHVAVVALDQGNEHVVWAYDVARGTRSRVDFGTGNLSGLAWAPGGERLAATADWNIATQSTDATRPPEIISGRDKVEEQPSWSRDGRYLFFDTYDGGADIWYVDLTQGSEPQRLLATPAFEGHAVLSPDGKHIAYTANESGRDEVYVREFPSLQKKHQVSVNGGRDARWSAGGDELFFVADTTLMAATVERGATLVTSVPKPLFTAEKIGATTVDYDVAPDGKRFVVVRTIQPRERRAVVIENWRSRLAGTP